MTQKLLKLATVAALALACSSRGSPADAHTGRIFREVGFGGTTITLGAALPPALGRPAPGDSIVALASRDFGGAEAIRVHLTSAGTVRSLWFDYALGADYEAMVAEYAEALGPPQRMPHRTGERATWDDGETRFELVRDPERSVATVFSVLSDRRATR